MPAPRPVPTMIAVGVARPRAQGQAITSTAMAGISACPTAWPVSKPADEGQQGQAEHHRHEDGGDAVGQALHRRLGALRLLHQADDPGQHRVPAHPRGLDPQQARAVDRGADHRVARPSPPAGSRR